MPGRDAAMAAELADIGRSATWVSPLGRWQWREPTAWRLADAMVALAVLAAVLVAGNLGNMPRGVPEFLAVRVSIKHILLVAAFAWIWPRMLLICGLYAPDRLRTGAGEWPRLAVAGVVGGLLALVFVLTSQSGAVAPLHALAFGVLVAPAAGMLRVAGRVANRKRASAPQRQVVMVGSGPLAQRMYRQLLADPANNIAVVGYVDSAPNANMAGAGVSHIGIVQDLEQILMHRVVDDVFIGLPVKSCYDDIMQSIVSCARAGVPASYSGDLFGGHPATSRGDSPPAPVLSLSRTPRAELLAFKRGMDIVGAALLLVACSPLLLIVAIAIKVTSAGPVLYSHERYGYMKRRFRMYKFRTMVANAEQMHASLEAQNEAAGPVFKIRNDPRVTWIGRLLRRTSLDEFPQLWHVLTGEMSLVGPRPLAIRDVHLFPEPWLMRRFSVRPGLTCLWQVSGRSNLGFDQWIALDLEYIDNWSLWLDLKILIRTPPMLLRGTGAV
jgi:exopolysaccharide biosynthesis polyprenyl glycosylphosphotransferase